MKIRLNADTVSYSKKPTEYTGAIQNRMTHPVELEISEIADRLVHGKAIRMCCCDGGSGDAEFESGQILSIDTDNKMSVTVNGERTEVLAPVMYRPEDVRRILQAEGIQVAFQVYTHSSTPEHPRFKTFIVLDKRTEDYGTYAAIMLYCNGLFEGFYADPDAQTVSRIAYGTTAGSLCYADYNAVNSLDDLVSRCRPEDIEEHRQHFTDLLLNKAEGKKTKKKSGRHKKIKATGTGNAVDEIVIDAIRNHKPMVLRKHLGISEKTVFNTRQEMFDYLYGEVELDAFLGVAEGKTFQCVFSEKHKNHDSNRSASVKLTNSGHWIYKCFAGCCGTPTQLNIKTLVEQIGGFKSEYDALNFLKKALWIEVKESEWSKRQRGDIDLILHSLASADQDGFAAQCHQASINTRNAYEIFTRMLLTARNLIPSDREGDDEQVIFFMSVSHLAQLTHKSIPKCQQYVKMLLYHRMLEIVPEAEIPEKMLKRAEAEARKNKNGKPRRRCEFYRIPSWVFAHLREIEDRGIRWKEAGYRIKFLTYESILRTDGIEIAKEVYPQNVLVSKKDADGNIVRDADGNIVKTIRHTTAEQDERHEAIAAYIIGQISQCGFCTESEIIENLDLRSKKGKKMTQAQVQRSIAEICSTYGLQKIRANKKLKEKYGLTGSGYPFIIVAQVEDFGVTKV